MLLQRVITAVVLLAVLLAALLSPGPLPLTLLLTLTAACALWEWLRLTWRDPPAQAPIVTAVIAAVALGALALQWIRPSPAVWATNLHGLIHFWLMPVVVLLWIVAVLPMVIRGQTSGRTGGLPLSLFGVVAIIAVWAALLEMFLIRGAWFLVSLLALVWFADIGAYFTGRALGKHKLAPNVSPGKTWEGAAGGILAAVVWVLATSYVENSFGAALGERWPLWGVALITVLLTALSIVGDLFESLLKRRAGVKDSSGLLPGHGGVYDRIDALLPVAPMALLLTGVWFQ